jgi:hypothetical protein
LLLSSNLLGDETSAQRGRHLTNQDQSGKSHRLARHERSVIRRQQSITGQVAASSIPMSVLHSRTQTIRPRSTTQGQLMGQHLYDDVKHDFESWQSWLTGRLSCFTILTFGIGTSESSILGGAAETLSNFRISARSWPGQEFAGAESPRSVLRLSTKSEPGA